MTPQDLSGHVADVVKRAQARVGPDSIGAQQYHVEGQPQKFETMELEALLDYATEESLDLINYAVMATIRFDRIRSALQGRTLPEDRKPLVGVCDTCRGLGIDPYGPRKSCPDCGGEGYVPVGATGP